MRVTVGVVGVMVGVVGSRVGYCKMEVGSKIKTKETRLGVKWFGAV